MPNDENPFGLLNNLEWINISFNMQTLIDKRKATIDRIPQTIDTFQNVQIFH